LQKPLSLAIYLTLHTNQYLDETHVIYNGIMMVICLTSAVSKL